MHRLERLCRDQCDIGPFATRQCSSESAPCNRSPDAARYCYSLARNRMLLVCLPRVQASCSQFSESATLPQFFFVAGVDAPGALFNGIAAAMREKLLCYGRKPGEGPCSISTLVPRARLHVGAVRQRAEVPFQPRSTHLLYYYAKAAHAVQLERAIMYSVGCPWFAISKASGITSHAAMLRKDLYTTTDTETLATCTYGILASRRIFVSVCTGIAQYSAAWPSFPPTRRMLSWKRCKRTCENTDSKL